MLKKVIAKIWANKHVKKSSYWKNNSVDCQGKLLMDLIRSAEHTVFGKKHNFKSINSIQEYQQNVPISNYESIKNYIEEIKQGKLDVLWKGKPLYFAKTSGTTSGAKYIPLSKESMPFHIGGIKSMLFHYIHQTKKATILDGKMIFVQGSPELDFSEKIPTGRLSGIVAHYVPKYLQKNRLPSWKTNCIEDWETKVDEIVNETYNQNMTAIGGIPPWLVMYFEKLIEKTGKKIGYLFPNLELIITGGVNYEPYRQKIEELLGRKIQILQTFPASEGFFAYQDDLNSENLLLLTNHGIFYEFIPMEQYGKPDAQRLTLKEVELDKDYALILTNNAGLWSYDIGDTVRFVSKKPYRIVVSGRTKHFTSAFGEHVIAYEVEQAIKETVEKFPCLITEFTLAPQINPTQGLPYHQWFIEFEKQPKNLEQFAEFLDASMRQKNTYYEDLISGNILKPLVITIVKKGAFNEYMKSQGKLGGQNKCPRLSNDRKIADFFYKEGLIVN
ncbi:MAG: GH3 auxin-responsive promoter family protein [Flavobacteriales bacterium]|nr:GH3 auxin-responsive promoter family protein [Flavobacteriales bacterium]